MTLLQKIGSYILKGIEIVSGILPMVTTTTNQGVVATVSADLAQVANIIVSAEAAGQAISASGAQMLTMAAPQVAQVILSSAILANHKISNTALFNTGVSSIASGMADILNSLDPSSVTVTSKTT
jgi:hypothetical protein